MAKAKSQKQEKQSEIQVTKLQRSAIKVSLMGDTPLIVHAWSQKAKLMMLLKHMTGVKPERIEKDPYEDFMQSMYRFEDGNYGFPVVAVKEAMATVTAELNGVARAQVYRNISVTGRRGFSIGVFAAIRSPHELAELFSPEAPRIREDMVRLSGVDRQPDIRYRAEFFPWALSFTLAYDANAFHANSVFNLLQRAGFFCGLGEWRQEKGGSNGAFHVADDEERQTVERWRKRGPTEPDKIDAREWLNGVLAQMPTKDERLADPVKEKKGNGRRREVARA